MPFKTTYLFVEWEVIWQAGDSPLSKELLGVTTYRERERKREREREREKGTFVKGNGN